MLPKEAILEYQRIYRELYRRDITFDDALKQATELLNIFKAVYKPIKSEWIKEILIKKESK